MTKRRKVICKPTGEGQLPHAISITFSAILKEMKRRSEDPKPEIAERYKLELENLEHFLMHEPLKFEKVRVPATGETTEDFVDNFGGIHRNGKTRWVTNERGQVEIKGRKESLSRIIHVSFFFDQQGPLPPDMMVTHANDIRSDNRAVNLQQRLTQSQCTTKRNRAGVSKSSAAARSKRIEGRPAKSSDDWEPFDSQMEAARQLSERLGREVHDANISMVVRGERPTAYGWVFRPVDDPDDPDEIWIEDLPHYKDGAVTILYGTAGSNKGRFRNAMGSSTQDPKPRADGYIYVGCQGKTYALHRLLCGAFHGPPPTPEHEVDHRNRNRSDNRAENLRWATKAENCENRG